MTTSHYLHSYHFDPSHSHLQPELRLLQLSLPHVLLQSVHSTADSMILFNNLSVTLEPPNGTPCYRGKSKFPTTNVKFIQAPLCCFLSKENGHTLASRPQCFSHLNTEPSFQTYSYCQLPLKIFLQILPSHTPVRPSMSAGVLAEMSWQLRFVTIRDYSQKLCKGLSKLNYKMMVKQPKISNSCKPLRSLAKSSKDRDSSLTVVRAVTLRGKLPDRSWYL